MTRPTHDFARAAAWRAVVGFGVVSLAADMVYEGARSVYGPLLGALGASALVVGLVTGAGEAMALVLRLAFGGLADRHGAYWPLTILGYGLTAVCVPLLAVTPFVGAAGLALAGALILAERAGKAVRSPSKSALLADVATQVGQGRGFGVHKALDEVGAFSGPLVVAGVIALTGAIWPAMLTLAIPGAITMALLVWLRRRVPGPGPAPRDGSRGFLREAAGHGLGRPFFLFAACVALTTAGLVTFGVISFHMVQRGLVPTAAVPVIYAGGQAASALAALVSGEVYDRAGPAVLLALPPLVAAVPELAFSSALAVAVAGVVLWGAAGGLQDSTVKALVAALAPRHRRASAFGVFAAIQGAAAVAGGGLAGWLSERHLPVLIAVVGAGQVVAFILLLLTLRVHRRHTGAVA